MNMREDLKAFIDNEVSESERTRILKELESNPELQAEVIELRQISRTIREETKEPQPVGLERTLGALTANRSSRPWWMNTPLQIAMVAACGALAIAIFFPVFAQAKYAAKRTSMEAAAPASAPAEFKSGAGFERTQSPMADNSVQGRERSTLPQRSEATISPSTAKVFRQPRIEIKTAQLSLEVEDIPAAQQEAESIAKGVGGRVESSSRQDNEGQLASADLTLRVPVASFSVAVNRIRKMGRVLSDSLTGQDVTSEVVDLEARLKVMRAEEDQYVEILRATKKVGEILAVKERLSRVRQEIESLDAQRMAMRDLAAESTIHLALSERPKPDRPEQNVNWSEDAWSRAVAGLNAVGRFLGSATVFLFVFSPIWLPVVLIGWWLSRRNRR